MSVYADFGANGTARPVNVQLNDGDFCFSQEITVPAGSTTCSIKVFVQDKAAYQANNFTLINQTTLDAIWKPGVQVIV
jgi:hypothetical protein